MPAGGMIVAVAPGSLAERAGLQAGDELLAVNDCPVRDVIDVQVYSAEERVSFRIRRGGRESTLRAARRYKETLGLEFAAPVFDGIRRCNNHCLFCFVSQSPPGLRPSLYIRDDDYRCSFLHGNYVTLTNLEEEDWRRIEEQRLSPLYVSVHATDLALRRRLLHNPAAPDVMEQLRRLAEIGIETHAQIVVIPGLNDGAHLERSVEDLAALYPAVRSVSIVPVGVTRFRRGRVRLHTEAEMRVIWELVSRWQARLRERLGVRFLYLADEWYLRLGIDVPPLEDYDGMDLTENGVGLVSRFEAGRAAWRAALGAFDSATLVTGTLFAPVLQRAVAGLPGVEVIPVVNHFWGETVTVAGLLTGRDVVARLMGQVLGEVVVLPAAMFGGPGGQTLDGLGVQEVSRALGREICTETHLTRSGDSVIIRGG